MIVDYYTRVLGIKVLGYYIIVLMYQGIIECYFIMVFRYQSIRVLSQGFRELYNGIILWYYSISVLGHYIRVLKYLCINKLYYYIKLFLWYQGIRVVIGNYIRL